VLHACSSYARAGNVQLSDPDLLGDEIVSSDHLDDRVLDLDAAVELHGEAELVIDEELEGAGALVQRRDNSSGVDPGVRISEANGTAKPFGWTYDAKLLKTA
jgi:hypothetical protein